MNVGVLPHKVGETPGQVHRGGAAAQHGQDTLQVEELQELMAAGAPTNTTLNTHVFIQGVYSALAPNKIMTLPKILKFIEKE